MTNASYLQATGPDETGIVAVANAGTPERIDVAPASDRNTASGRAIRLLVFTSLYPNAAQPRHGIFVEERLRHLIGSGRITATVVAPVPWFPFRHPRFGAYSVYARVPKAEERHGIRVLHPRYPVIPKLGMNLAPALMYRALLPVMRNLVRHADGFDVIDAHYLYPDGVAAARIGAVLGVPVVMTARGSDVNVIPQHRSAARQILKATDDSAATATVSEALKSRLIGLGADAGKITVLRNGVDPGRFRLLDRDAIRPELGLTGPVWLAVGHLVESKGVRITLEALATVPDATLLIVGEGPQRIELRSHAGHLGVGGRVRFLGEITQEALCRLYNAADAMLLASSREGMPNVVLESLACGTPVIATPFAGVEELITAPEAGEITESRTPEAIASAWQRLVARHPERSATRRFAERLSWAPVIQEQCAMYARVSAEHRRDGARRESP